MSSAIPSLFGPCRGQRFLVFTIDSDACFYPRGAGSYALTSCGEAGVETQHLTVSSTKGHDSILLEPELYAAHFTEFMAAGV